jgi:hypothetical protein
MALRLSALSIQRQAGVKREDLFTCGEDAIIGSDHVPAKKN